MIKMLADRVGQVFADDDDAIAHAMLHTRNIAAERARSGCLSSAGYVDVRNESGEAITRITFTEALDVDSPHETMMAFLPLLSFAPVFVAAVSAGVVTPRGPLEVAAPDLPHPSAQHCRAHRKPPS